MYQTKQDSEKRRRYGGNDMIYGILSTGNVLMFLLIKLLRSETLARLCVLACMDSVRPSL